MGETMKKLLSLQRPTKTGCRSASYPVVIGHVRLGKPIGSTVAGQAISIFAREILTWLLSLLVKLGGGTFAFVTISFLEDTCMTVIRLGIALAMCFGHA